MTAGIPDSFPETAGARVRLRPFRHDDLPAFVDYRSDPEVARYQSWGGYDMARAEAFWAEQRGHRLGVPGTWVQVAIANLDDDLLIGDLGLHTLADGRQLELGYSLARPWQGRGLATEAVTLVLGLAFEDWQVHRVVATTDAKNTRSARLLERLGFRREGHFIQNIWFKGAWGDELMYAQLASEWSRRR